MFPFIAYILCCFFTYAGHKYIQERFNIDHYDGGFFTVMSSLLWPFGAFYITGECMSKLAEKHREDAKKLIAARTKAEESKHRLHLSSTEDLLEELSLREDLRSGTSESLKKLAS